MYIEGFKRKCTHLFLEETRKIKGRSHSNQLKSVDMSRLCTRWFLDLLQEKKSTISSSEYERAITYFYPIPMFCAKHLPL
jgi:hypothetical protein